MRVLWHSNWIRDATGYGKQTREVVLGLKAAGHEVVVSASHGIQGGAVEVDGIAHVPGALFSGDMGHVALPQHVKRLRPQVVVTLTDLWPMPADLGARLEALGAAWVPWVPVDHQPCPAEVSRRAATARRVVAMSRFGQRELERAGVAPAFIPHVVDTRIYLRGDRAAARAALGLPPDTFLVVMVQANHGYPPRKCIPQQLEGFSLFHRKHPESMLYLHSWEGDGLGGLRLPRLVEELGLVDAVLGMDPYAALVGLDDLSMARIYQAADVTLNATGGEGFGVPIIESLACGTPVIVSDFSAMSELCPPEVGWRVKELTRFYTFLDAWQVVPSPMGIAEALEASLMADREAMAPACVEFGGQFDSRRVIAEKWLPLLAELESPGRSRPLDARKDPTVKEG